MVICLNMLAVLLLFLSKSSNEKSFTIPNDPIQLNLLGSKDVDTSLFLIPNRKIYLNYHDKIKRKERQFNNEQQSQKDFLLRKSAESGSSKPIFASELRFNQKATKQPFRRNILSHQYSETDTNPPSWAPCSFKKSTVIRNYPEQSKPSNPEKMALKSMRYSLKSDLDDSDIGEVSKEVVFLKTSDILKHHKVKQFDSQTPLKMNRHLLKTEDSHSDNKSYESERKKFIQLATEEIDFLDDSKENVKLPPKEEEIDFEL